MIFNKKFIKKNVATLFVLILSFTAHAQLTTSTAMTPTQLVQNILLGSGITASNITYNGAPLAIGSFNGSSSNIGLASGVLLASGNISTAIGPNNSGSAGTNLSQPADVDLNAISGNTTYDRAVLEFDFIPVSDTVKFKYVFGSEEYMEFVNSGVNDAFGFFISGPGITGAFSNNSKNIALIPGTPTPVTIDNVNANLNSAYYFNNQSPSGQTIQYDGFTLPLTAISEVQCGETYHIKIAIADAGDGVWDSGVFLEAGSFSSTGVSIISQISYGGANDSTLFEGCGSACIYFVRTANLANQDTVNLTISGSAINGTDYYDNMVGPGTPLPSQLIFAAGQDSISFCFNAFADGSTEGVEAIELAVTSSGNGFCIPPSTTATIYLNEYSPLVLSTSDDTTLCNLLGPISLAANVTGGVEPYSYSWTNGGGSIPNPVVNPTINTSYVITVNDACTGSPTDPTPAVTDSVTVIIATVPVITSTINYGGTNDSTFYEGCGQACLFFVRTLGVAQSATFTLSAAGTAGNGTDYTPVFPTQLTFAPGQDSMSYCINAPADGTTEATETIQLSINISGSCNLSADAALYIEEAVPLTLTTNNDTILNCTTGPVNLFVNVSGGVPPYSYLWSNSITAAFQTVVPSSNTSYTIKVSDACTGFPDPTPNSSDSITVALNIPLPLAISAGNDITACPDDNVRLDVTTTGGALPLIYSWISSGSDSINAAGTANASIIVTSPATYTITVVDDCGNTQNDQVAVNVEANCLLVIPNIITPDGMGPALNETFYIENLNRFPSSSLVIYSRWGNKIYEAADYQNNWNGSKTADGTYYYILTVSSAGPDAPKVKPSGLEPSFEETENGSKKVFAGFFQIIRSK